MRPSLVNALMATATKLHQLGENARMLPLAREAVRLLELLVLVDAIWRRSLVEALRLSADGLAAVGQDEQASEATSHAFAIAEQLP